MIKFESPVSGQKYALTIDEAEKFCETEAAKECLSNGTRIYSTLRSKCTVRISTKEKTWIIYVQD